MPIKWSLVGAPGRKHAADSDGGARAFLLCSLLHASLGLSDELVAVLRGKSAASGDLCIEIDGTVAEG